MTYENAEAKQDTSNHATFSHSHFDSMGHAIEPTNQTEFGYALGEDLAIIDAIERSIRENGYYQDYETAHDEATEASADS